jgi:hypothetical protein
LVADGEGEVVGFGIHNLEWGASDHIPSARPGEGVDAALVAGDGDGAGFDGGSWLVESGEPLEFGRESAEVGKSGAESDRFDGVGGLVVEIYEVVGAEVEGLGGFEEVLALVEGGDFLNLTPNPLSTYAERGLFFQSFPASSPNLGRKPPEDFFWRCDLTPNELSTYAERGLKVQGELVEGGDSFDEAGGWVLVELAGDLIGWAFKFGDD